jgi:hypothetical protein
LHRFVYFSLSNFLGSVQKPREFLLFGGYAPCMLYILQHNPQFLDNLLLQP